MADDFEIKARFDISGVEAGMSALRESLQSLTPSLAAVEQAAQGASRLLDTLGVATETLEPSIGKVGTAALASAQQLGLMFPALENLNAEMALSVEASQQMQNALDAQVLAVAGFTEASTAAAAALTPVAEQLEMFGVNIAEVPAPLAEATGQLALFTQATSNAAGQLSLFDTEIAALGEQAAGTLAPSLAVASAATGMFNLSLDETAGFSAKARAAVEFLNNSTARASATQQEVAAAFKLVQNEANKLGLTLVATGDGFAFVAKETQDATRANNAFQQSVAISTGSLLGQALGLGQIGMNVGFLSRSFSGLMTVLNALFIPAILVTMGDIIYKLWQEFVNMEATIRKNGAAFDDLATSVITKGDALEITMLRAGDASRKLFGQLEENTLQIALVENKHRAEELAKALGDAAEKALQLLEQQNLGFFHSLITGYAQTYDLKGIIQDDVIAFEVGQARVQEAIAKSDKAGEQAARADVERARNAALQKLQIELKAIQDKVEAAKKGQTELLSVDEYGRPTKTQYSAEEIQKQYGPREQALRSLILMFEETARAEQRLADANKATTKTAQDQMAVDRARQAYTFNDTDLKNQEAANKRALVEAKRISDDKLKIATEAAKEEAAGAQTEGTDRYTAIVAADEKIIAAIKEHVQARLEEEYKYYDERRALLDKEETNVNANPNQAQRVVQLKNLAAERERLEAETTSNLMQIVDQGTAAQSRVETESKRATAQKLLALNREIVSNERDAAGETIAIARMRSQEEIAEVRAANAIKLRDIDQLEGIGVITARTAWIARKGIFDEEAATIKKIYKTQEDAIEGEMATVRALLQSDKLDAKSKQDLMKIYQRLGLEKEKIASDSKKANIAITRDNDEAARRYKESWERAMAATRDIVSNQLTSFLMSQQSFKDSMINIWNTVAANFINNLIKMGIQMLISTDLHKKAAMKDALISAKSAAIKTYESVSAIPMVGWLLAPPAAAAAFAAVMAFGTFAKGGVAPTEMMAHLHPDEMVLPPHLSKGLQKMITTGQPASGQGHAFGTGSGKQLILNPVYNLSAMDAAGLDAVLTRHTRTLQRHVKRMVRNGVFQNS